MEGTVVGIFIAPAEAAPVVEVEQVRAVRGKGLEGDRYFKMSDDAERWDRSKEVTLIESEGLEAARRDFGLDLAPGEHRRNIVTSGLSLRELIGKEFSVGEVRLRGLEDNPPCRHLVGLTGKPLLKPLIDKGGIRAEIVVEGSVRIGDPISERSGVDGES
jgi:MOSC domain-containing protein YiiM